ncbi:MAG TPA: hypothetical protein VJ747_03505 [Stellaceae bacterium]|nr:hypothetical protein [Stellaceae bacterium]
MADAEKAIRYEICKALEHLGGPPKLLEAMRSGSKEALYEAAERLGADGQLLTAIAAWGDTLSDAQVLLELREWNAATASTLSRI